MTKVIHDISEMQHTAGQLRAGGMRLAVVPTMGSLHDGHMSLIRTGKQHADIVITTIFVNPAQFGPGEDYERYPRNLPQDISLAGEAESDYIFAPEAKAMYPDGFLTQIQINRLGDVLEGKVRPGHFRGVATIVAKLFIITMPHVAVFGQKDAQQVVVIRRMMRDLDFPIELVVAPIVREPDGLALSSRNVYLTPAQRAGALALNKSLRLAEQLIRSGEKSSSRVIREMTGLISSDSSGVVDYISIADADTLDELDSCTPLRPLLISLAVRFGSTRLIDNTIVTA